MLFRSSQLVNLDEVARIAKKYGLKVKVIDGIPCMVPTEAREMKEEEIEELDKK